MDVGDTVGRYRLEQRIGRGGMGEVFLARDLTHPYPDQAMVAIKMLHAHLINEETRARLGREVSTAQRISHPCVARIIDADINCPTPYIVAEYVNGPTLSEHVRALGPMTRSDLATFAAGLGEAIAAVHIAGVIHRDIKPSNVLMHNGRPMLIDFGIAHTADTERLTQTGLVMGTPGYLAPELLEHKALDASTDWWAWAATVVFAATGRDAFGTGPADVILGRIIAGKPDLTGVPTELLGVLSRSLSPNPHARPQPAELRQAVMALAANAVAAPRPDADVTRPIAGPGSTAPAAYTPPLTSPMPAAINHVRPADHIATAPLLHPNGDHHRPAHPPANVPVRPTVALPATPRGAVDGADQHPSAGPSKPPNNVLHKLFGDYGRTRLLLLAGAVFVVVGAIDPTYALAALWVWVVLAYTMERTVRAVHRREAEVGKSTMTPWVVSVGTLWRLPLSVLASLPLMLLALAGYLLGGFAAGALEAGYGDAVPGPTGSVPSAIGCLIAAWLVTMAPRHRLGSRVLMRSVSSGPTAPTLLAAVLALAVIAGFVVVAGERVDPFASTGGKPPWVAVWDAAPRG